MHFVNMSAARGRTGERRLPQQGSEIEVPSRQIVTAKAVRRLASRVPMAIYAAGQGSAPHDATRVRGFPRREVQSSLTTPASDPRG